MANPVNKTPFVLLNEYIDKAEKILENPADIKTAELFKVFSDLKLSETRKWIDQNDRFKVLSGIADANATKIESILNDRGLQDVKATSDLERKIGATIILAKTRLSEAKISGNPIEFHQSLCDLTILIDQDISSFTKPQKDILLENGLFGELREIRHSIKEYLFPQEKAEIELQEIRE